MAENIARKLDPDGDQALATAPEAAPEPEDSRGPEVAALREDSEPEPANLAEVPAATEPTAASAAPSAAPPEVVERMEKLERNNRVLRYALLALALGVGWLGYHKVFPEGVTVHKTMMESKELKLLDADGNARLFLRMYSRVPVLQLMDGNGKPRMSLGLRFDNTPFIDLSDQTGRTRATLEMTEEDAPALRLFNQDGTVKFQIN